MAVQNSDNQARTSGSNPGVFQKNDTQQAASAAASPAASNPFDLSSWGMNEVALSGPVSQVLGSEDIFRLKEKIVKAFELTNDKSFSSMVLVAEKLAYYSAIVVAMSHNSAPGIWTYFTLVVEASAAGLDTLTETYANEQYRVPRPAIVAIDELFANRIAEFVSTAISQVELHNAGVLLIPRTFDTSDDKAVQNVAHEISFANTTELAQRNPSFREFTLEKARGDTSLIADVKFQRQTLFPVVGLPLRSDITINFAVEPARIKRNESPNAVSGQSISFGKTSSYMDVIWAPPQNTVQGAWGAVQQNTPTQTFMARQVITEIAPEKVATLGAILLLLAESTALSTNYLWMNAFRRDHRLSTAKFVDRTDYGVLNIEANIERNSNGIGTRINTVPGEQDEQGFRESMQAIFHPTLALSIDVDRLAPKGWALEMLLLAANGDSEALTMIEAAANELTKNEFAKFYKRDAPMFVERDNYLHAGFFTAPDGQLTDLRAIDHIAVLNILGAADPKAGRRWSDTFYGTARPLSVRLSDRLDMLEAITNSQMTITGMIQRITPSRELLTALTDAAYSAGLRMNLRAPLNVAGQQSERAAADFVGQAAMNTGGQGNGLFGMPGYTGNAQNSYNPYANGYSRR